MDERDGLGKLIDFNVLCYSCAYFGPEGEGGRVLPSPCRPGTVVGLCAVTENIGEFNNAVYCNRNWFIPCGGCKYVASKPALGVTGNERLERTLEFLRGYYELCKRHHMHVGACGHCDSPWLVGDERPSKVSLEDVEGHVYHLVDTMWDDSGNEELDKESKEAILRKLGLEGWLV